MISTHAPLAGRDFRRSAPVGASRHFNPRAPCGARPSCTQRPAPPPGFQPTRPLRGATPTGRAATGAVRFQPTRPLRGATKVRGRLIWPSIHFNPRAPCGARRRPRTIRSRFEYFNPRAPCGARHLRCQSVRLLLSISTHAPLAGRDLYQYEYINLPTDISTHAPLAGRDWYYWLCRHLSENFNPRAPCGARQQKCTNHYAHFCDNRQISDVFAQNADCQGILFLFCARKTCKF